MLPRFVALFRLANLESIAISDNAERAAGTLNRMSTLGGTAAEVAGPDGTIAVVGPIQGKVFKMLVETGEEVKRGQMVCVLEAMKMEHEIKADKSGTVRQIMMGEGDVVREGCKRRSSLSRCLPEASRKPPRSPDHVH